VGSRALWLLDLDNTLYDASWRVMGEINRRMTRYVADKLSLSLEDASALREKYWHRYGATLLGLIRHHGVDPHDFLNATHPVGDLPEFVRRLRGERYRLRQLRGERWLFTNAPRAYADHVLELVGLRQMFSRIISIEDMRACGRLCPKPSALLMRKVLALSGRPAGRVVLVDDHDENLLSAHRLGMPTARIWASKTALSRARHSGRPLTVRRPGYVRLQVNSLATLLRNQHRLVTRQR
jgi:putative hydrolase of the HAD superfamily